MVGSHTCELCQKEFTYKSKLLRHQNRKKSCNNTAKDFICCNVDFKTKFNFERHIQSNKHLTKDINEVIQKNIHKLVKKEIERKMKELSISY